MVGLDNGLILEMIIWEKGSSDGEELEGERAKKEL